MKQSKEFVTEGSWLTPPLHRWQDHFWKAVNLHYFLWEMFGIKKLGLIRAGVDPKTYQSKGIKIAKGN